MVLDSMELLSFFFWVVTFWQHRLPSHLRLCLPEGSFELGALPVVLVVRPDALALELNPTADTHIDVFLDSICFFELHGGEVVLHDGFESAKIVGALLNPSVEFLHAFEGLGCDLKNLFHG